ncbi:MAG: hypothetical protein NWF00_09595 [Candidatus Bathyarchaeota archaeon]|nr:hypothetical protein [Candidatus Bathyarchaeota archaeon]
MLLEQLEALLANISVVSSMFEVFGWNRKEPAAEEGGVWFGFLCFSQVGAVLDFQISSGWALFVSVGGFLLKVKVE